MKFKFRLYCSIFLTSLLLLYPLVSTVYASQSKSEFLIANFKEDNKIISSVNITPLKEASGTKNNISFKDTKKYRTLLLKLGYANKELDAIGDKEIYNTLKNATKVTVIESYVKVSSDGKTNLIDKDTCFQKVMKLNLQSTSTYATLASNNASNIDDSTDGYMKIITQATYISKGYYTLSGSFTRLTMPSSRMKDSISIAAPNCAWTSGTGDLYSSYYYNMFKHDGTARPEDTTQTYSGVGHVTVASTGIYAQYNLPDNYDMEQFISYGRVTDMSYYIRGKARVSNYTMPTAFNVFSRYEHVWSSLGVQPSFSWTVEGISANVDITLVNNHKLYSSYCYVNYRP